MALWFRMYAEVLNDPKAQKLTGDLFKAWVNILCLTAQSDGRLPPLPDIAFALRMTEVKAEATLESLTKSGLIDNDETGITPHNWSIRQYKSDVSTERVKRFRKRRETVSETSPEPETDTDSETEPEKKEENTHTRARDEIEKAFDNYNLIAEQCGLPKAISLTEDRRERIHAILRRHPLSEWNCALENLLNSDFCQGKKPQGHKIDFEFLCKPLNFIRLLEGGYNDGEFFEPGANRDAAGNSGGCEFRA